MSDIQLRTDEHVARTRAGYDAQRYGSMQQSGQALEHIGAMQQAQQQIDQKWVEIGQRGAAQQAEIQIAQKKLLAAQALDQTELSRQTVRQATLQNEAMDLQLKMQRKQFDALDEDKQARMDAELAKTLNASGNEGRYKFDPTAPAGHRFTPRSDTEFKAWTQEQQEARSHTAGGNYDVEAKRAQNEWLALARERQQMANNGASEEELAQLEPLIEEARNHYLSFRPGAGGASKNGAKSEPKQTAASSGEVGKISARIGGKMPADQKADLAGRMLRARADVLKAMREHNPKATEEDAMERMLHDLNEAGDPANGRRAKLIEYLQGLQ
jgi:hypothetical protein